MSITITKASHLESSWERAITFEYEGTQYRVLLYWDIKDGYAITFLDDKNNYIAPPQWWSDWDEEESFESQLDRAFEEARN